MNIGPVQLRKGCTGPMIFFYVWERGGPPAQSSGAAWTWARKARIRSIWFSATARPVS